MALPGQVPASDSLGSHRLRENRRSGGSGEVIDEEFAVWVGEFRSGDGERRSEGFQQGLGGMIGLPAKGDG